jgi:sulfite dehydrogenase (quinone) subunit SoeA
MVAYADLILPDTTYLERWDCISLLDRPISEPTARATRSASRWSSPTATCAASRTC